MSVVTCVVKAVSIAAGTSASPIQPSLSPQVGTASGAPFTPATCAPPSVAACAPGPWRISQKTSPKAAISTTNSTVHSRLSSLSPKAGSSTNG